LGESGCVPPGCSKRLSADDGSGNGVCFQPTSSSGHSIRGAYTRSGTCLSVASASQVLKLLFPVPSTASGERKTATSFRHLVVQRRTRCWTGLGKDSRVGTPWVVPLWSLAANCRLWNEPGRQALPSRACGKRSTGKRSASWTSASPGAELWPAQDRTWPDRVSLRLQVSLMDFLTGFYGNP